MIIPSMDSVLGRSFIQFCLFLGTLALGLLSQVCFYPASCLTLFVSELQNLVWCSAKFYSLCLCSFLGFKYLMPCFRDYSCWILLCFVNYVSSKVKHSCVFLSLVTRSRGLAVPDLDCVWLVVCSSHAEEEWGYVSQDSHNSVSSSVIS